MNKAIGIVSCENFTDLVVITDAMLKAAKVELIKYEKMGDGRVSVVITGSIASVRASLDAAGDSQRSAKVISALIANPAEGLEMLLQGPNAVVKENRDIGIATDDDYRFVDY